MGTLETGNLWHGFKQGVVQGGIGCLTGAAVGGLIQGTTSAIKGNNFGDGSTLSSNRNYNVSETFTREDGIIFTVILYLREDI